MTYPAVIKINSNQPELPPIIKVDNEIFKVGK
jgi:hypothetical protein